MTLALDKRRRIVEPSRRRAFGDDLREALLVLIRQSTRLTWPSPRYAKDPVAFSRDILGFDPWARQREVMRAVVEHPLVSVKSGHRVGKSWLAGSLALWFYCSFPDARVICTAPTATNVQGVIWRAIRQLHARSGRCLACTEADPSGPVPCPHGTAIDSRPAERAGTGLVSEDMREVKGYTVRDVEAICGTAGAYLLFIMDEASGVADAIFEGLEGNRAGWTEEAGVMVRMLLIGNPTRTMGEFYDSHEHPRKKEVYHRITISSKDTPNVVERKNLIPGLATHYWVEQMAAKYGEDSAFYKVRVLGEFPVGEDGKAFSIALITEAEARWPETEAVGVLQIGLDPAGDSGTGDNTAMVARRGDKILALRRLRGLSDRDHAMHLEALIEELREHPREKAVVVIDSEGKVGWDTYTYLQQVASRASSTFELHRVRASDKAIREPLTFDRVRDELAHNLWTWMRGGGALLEDEQLETELHALEWEVGTSGRQKITPKKVLKRVLGRSPDSYDALALAVWPVLDDDGDAAEDEAEEDEDDLGDGMDPYDDGGIDPYS
jgi:phage terminase large subunit